MSSHLITTDILFLRDSVFIQFNFREKANRANRPLQAKLVSSWLSCNRGKQGWTGMIALVVLRNSLEIATRICQFSNI